MRRGPSLFVRQSDLAPSARGLPHVSAVIGGLLAACWPGGAQAQSWLDGGAALELRRESSARPELRDVTARPEKRRDGTGRFDLRRDGVARPELRRESVARLDLRHDTFAPLDPSAFAQGRRDDVDRDRRDRPDSSAERLDTSSDRSETSRDTSKSSSDKDKDKKPSAPKDLEFAITIPADYTSRAFRATTEDVVARDKPDVHVHPDVALKYSHQFDWFKLSSTAGAGIDRYFEVKDADEDTLFWSGKVQFTDGKQDLFIPYIGYSGIAGFEPGFRRNTDILNDLYTGFKSGIGFKKDGTTIQSSDATDPGQSSVVVDLRVTRRVAQPSRQDNVQLSAEVEYSYVFSKEWSVSVAPKVRLRWYDDPVDDFGTHRRDIRSSLLAKAVWTPEWLTKVLPKAEIDFQFYFLRNYSNIKEDEFVVWELGPQVVLAWKF
jgi:hypothetical protein